MPRTSKGSGTGDGRSAESSGEFDVLLRAVAAAPEVPLDSATESRLLPGTLVDDTYRIEAVLGQGAMGVVYEASDVALDRLVAVKLHARGGDDPRRSRMWREAKAMARLAHPNVIAVHEIGVHEGRVYIAMERVAGGTLRDWLEEPRSWREIVDVFVQAGHGLAAAHDVGLVHRDFKPSNLLMGEDGRVRVADFGLALAAGNAPSSRPDRPEGSRDESPSLDDKVTATGKLVGTPAYMAPEQRSGRGVEPRSDQFSFCVSLHEALYGTRPVIGDSRSEQSSTSASPEGRSQPPRRVPPWVRSVVARGLSLDPNLRYPDMYAIVAALRDDPTPRRWLLAGAAGVVVLGAGTWGAVRYNEARGRDECHEQAAAIAEVWNDDARGRVREAFENTELLYAGQTLEAMDPFVSRYTAQWREAYVAGCISARVEETGDPMVWDQSRACLETRRQELQALVDALAEAIPATVNDGVAIAASLRGLTQCSDEAWLRRNPMPQQRRASAHRRDLQRAAALSAAGRYKAAQELAEDVHARLADSDDVRLRAEAATLTGELLLESGPPAAATTRLGEAFDLSMAAGDDDRALEVATELIYAVGVIEDRYDEGLWWERVAQGLLHRVDGIDTWADAMLRSNVGMVYEAKGDYERARDNHERTLELHLRELDPTHPDVAYAHNNLGTTFVMLGMHDEAERELTAAADSLEQVFGATHPQVGIAFNNLGSLYRRQDRQADAERALSRALEAFEGGLGRDHPQTAKIHGNLGNLLRSMGRYEDAERELDRAHEIVTTSAGPDAAGLAAINNHLALLYQETERKEEAERLHREALRIATASYGADDLRTAASHKNLANLLRELGRDEEAAAQLGAAVSIYADKRGADHASTAGLQLELGMLQLELGDAERAAELLRAGLATIGESGDATKLAKPRFDLARALARSGGDPAESRALAADALAASSGTSAEDAERRTAIERWLAADTTAGG